MSYSYKLRLSAHFFGDRVFESSGESDSDYDVLDLLACDIARALSSAIGKNSTMPGRLVRALFEDDDDDYSSVFNGIAEADAHWDGYLEFEDAVKVTVDLDKLMSNRKFADRELVGEVLKKFGFEVVGPREEVCEQHADPR